jgi:hypothetical protein
MVRGRPLDRPVGWRRPGTGTIRMMGRQACDRMRSSRRRPEPSGGGLLAIGGARAGVRDGDPGPRPVETSAADHPRSA